MTDEGLSVLRAYLGQMPPAKVTDTDKLALLLCSSWAELDAGSDGGMTGDKLLGRMEDVHWEPPVLSFRIERHGGTVLGSVYARALRDRWQAEYSRRT